MTLKFTRSKVLTTLIAALCVLAAVFAVSFSHSTFAEDGDGDGEGEVAPLEPGVYWEYTADDVEHTPANEVEWHSVQNGDYPFTYSSADYSNQLRAKIVTASGELTKTEYVVYKANDSEGMYLSYSGEFGGSSVTTLVNATEYTATVNGVPEDYNLTDEDKTVVFNIAALNVDSEDFMDYNGEGDENRLWALQLSGGTSALRDRTTYYDPDAEFSVEYGATVTTGAYYNAYVRYTGSAQTIVLNNDYLLKGVRLGAFDLSVSYKDGEQDTNTATGDAEKVNEITTTATITLNDNFLVANGQDYVEVRKIWYIVTINNALRMWDGNEYAEVAGWMYGDDVTDTFPVRPEHGDNAVLTLSKDGEVVERFATKYSGSSVVSSTVKYFQVKQSDGNYVIDESKALENGYYGKVLSSLGVGAYSINVYVPAYTSTSDHKHWWDNAEDASENIVFYPVSITFNFAVSCYELSVDRVSLSSQNKNTDIVITLLSNRVFYNGMDSNVPEVVVTFRGNVLEDDVDYKIESPNVRVGNAALIINGKGTFLGSVQFEDAYEIVQGTNSWEEVPGIMMWTYGSYNREINRISAIPAFLDNKNELWFKITTDKIGDKSVSDVLGEFRLVNGLVSDEVAAELSVLPVGTYYLFGTVNESTNYKRLAPRGVAFNVFRGVNSWNAAPTISSWTEGKFKAENLPFAQAMFGNDSLVLVVKDSNGKQVYNSESGLNILKSAKAGVYTLTATVAGTSDYTSLDFSATFVVFEKPGLPWWVTLLIVLGVLLVVALVIFILWKTGVFSILTENVMVKLRTQATVDATIAAIRANKRNEEAKQRVEELAKKEQEAAKRKERNEARKSQPALTTEQKAEALSEKAKKAAERAEKIRARSEAMQARAQRMLEKSGASAPTEAPVETEQPAAEQPEESAADTTESEDK